MVTKQKKIRKIMADEKILEQKLVKKVKSLGGLCLKFVSPGCSGIPDRLVLIAFGKVAFVEVKAKGKKPRPLQIKIMNEIKNLGFKVFVFDDGNQIGGILDEIQST